MFLCSMLLLEGCSWRNKKKEQTDDAGIAMINNSDAQECDSKDCSGEIIVDIAPEEEGVDKVNRLSIFDNDDSGELQAEKIDDSDDSRKETPITLLLSDDSDLDVSIEQKNNTNANISDKLNQSYVGTVNFAFDKFKAPKNNDYFEMEKIVAQIHDRYAQNKNIKVLITGHSCNWAGSEKYNLQLSDKRALTVSKYIMKHTSLSRDNIMHYGCGTSQLLTDGDKEQQSVNRRAEVFICE